MAYDVYKNSIITDGVYAGETELGVDLFTGEELVPLDTVISKEFVCSRCRRPVDMLICEQTKNYICPECQDDPAPRRS